MMDDLAPSWMKFVMSFDQQKKQKQKNALGQATSYVMHEGRCIMDIDNHRQESG